MIFIVVTLSIIIWMLTHLETLMVKIPHQQVFQGWSDPLRHVIWDNKTHILNLLRRQIVAQQVRMCKDDFVEHSLLVCHSSNPFLHFCNVFFFIAKVSAVLMAFDDCLHKFGRSVHIRPYILTLLTIKHWKQLQEKRSCQQLENPGRLSSDLVQNLLCILMWDVMIHQRHHVVFQ